MSHKAKTLGGDLPHLDDNREPHQLWITHSWVKTNYFKHYYAFIVFFLTLLFTRSLRSPILSVSCGNRAARSGMWPSYGMKWDEEPFPFSPPSPQLMKTRPISRLSLHGCEFVTKSCFAKNSN